MCITRTSEQRTGSDNQMIRTPIRGGLTALGPVDTPGGSEGGDRQTGLLRMKRSVSIGWGGGHHSI